MFLWATRGIINLLTMIPTVGWILGIVGAGIFGLVAGEKFWTVPKLLFQLILIVLVVNFLAARFSIAVDVVIFAIVASCAAYTFIPNSKPLLILISVAALAILFYTYR